jgi:hypothetical protein
MDHVPDRLTLLKCAAFITWQIKTTVPRTSTTFAEISRSRPEIVFFTEELCALSELKHSDAQKIHNIMDEQIDYVHSSSFK